MTEFAEERREDREFCWCFCSILGFLWGEILRGLWSFNLVCLLVERWIDSAVSGLGRETCWV